MSTALLYSITCSSRIIIQNYRTTLELCQISNRYNIYMSDYYSNNIIIRNIERTVWNGCLHFSCIANLKLEMISFEVTHFAHIEYNEESKGGGMVQVSIRSTSTITALPCSIFDNSMLGNKFILSKCVCSSVQHVPVSS